jgi:hypothetical protein
MPQDSSTHSRKPKREKRPKQERQQRTHEEPHFNVGAPRTPRRGQPGSPGGRSRTRRPDVSDAGAHISYRLCFAIEASIVIFPPGSIPDYPPPSFDEAIAAAAADMNVSPVSPAGSTTTHTSSPDRPQPAPILIPPLPRTQNQPVVTRTLPDSSESSESVRYSTQAECDSDSDGDLEVISTSDEISPTTPSEQDSPRNPTPGGTQTGSWTTLASGDTVNPSQSQLTLTPHLNGTSQGGDDQSIASPSTESQVGDFLVARNSTPSPVPPKRRLHLLSGFLKSRDNYTASAPSTPTYAAASQLSLPLNHPGSPSKPHRGESLIARKLFGHKGKERSVDPDPERPLEPLETWEMLSDVERDVPPASSIPEQLPCSPGPSAPGLRLLSPEPRRKGARSKHRSLLNHRVLPPSLPLASAGQRHIINSSTDVDPRELVVPVPSHQEFLASPPLATSSAPPAVPIPSSLPERPLIQSMHALLKPSAIVDNASRGRTLRATSSMVWASGRRNSPVPSPTRTVTAPTSPSTASMLSSVTNANIDHDTGTHARDDPEGAVPPSPVQEEEEEDERFVTPPGSPDRSLAALPLANRSRHPSPVRHEGRPGVSLRDDGPVPPPLGNSTRSDPHPRIARAPTITPRPSVNALHTFGPLNPSPLSNQSFERHQAAISPPPTTFPTIENMAAPKRDTVVSIGDTESLIELYASSPGPTTTIPAASSVTRATVTATSDPVHRAPTPTNGADPKQHHYPGRPLPHPPGGSQSGPVRPVLLDLFLAGNIPAGLPPYTEVVPGEQRSTNAFSTQSQPKQNPYAICPPSPPLFNQSGGGYIPPPIPPPGLLAMLDDDAMSEPSSPGSTYEMPSSPSVPFAIQREFTSLEALETRGDDYDGDGDESVAITTTNSNREARHLPSALAPYCVADPRTSTMTEHVSGTEYQRLRAPGIDNKDDGTGDWDGDACGERALQRERGTTGPSPGGTTASHAQWASEAQAGSAWNNCGSMRGVQSAVPGQ